MPRPTKAALRRGDFTDGSLAEKTATEKGELSGRRRSRVRRPCRHKRRYDFLEGFSCNSSSSTAFFALTRSLISWSAALALIDVAFSPDILLSMGMDASVPMEA